MVYLPRHSKHKKKFNLRIVVFGIVFIGLASTGFFLRREILFLFAGDQRIRLEKYNKKIVSEILSAGVSPDSIHDFKKVTQDLVTFEPLNPSGYHYYSKVYIYELFASGFRFDNLTLIDLVYRGTDSFYEESKEISALVESAFRLALKARAVKPEFAETDSNNVILFFTDMMRGKKKKSFLVKEFSLIQKEKVSPELLSVFIWTSIANASLAGDVSSLEKALDWNKSDKKIELSAKEISFLTGYAYFSANDFIRALQYFRESKNPNLDKFTVDVSILESIIFFKQNLHQKAINDLEKLYKDTDKKYPVILKKIKMIMETKPGLKTTLNLDQVE